MHVEVGVTVFVSTVCIKYATQNSKHFELQVGGNILTLPKICNELKKQTSLKNFDVQLGDIILTPPNICIELKTTVICY